MSSAQRLPQNSVIDALFDQPTSFEFFQAIRLLQLYFKQHKQVGADKTLNELLSFKSSISMAFPKGELEGLSETDGRYTLTPTMLGLTGNLGALPLVYSQKLASSLWAKKNGSLAFLDLFNNRLINLFYQSSIKSNLPLLSELDHEKNYLYCIHALEGYVPRQNDSKDDFINQSFAEFSGLIQGQMLNVESIQQILCAVLKQSVVIHQFIPEWFVIPEHHRSVLQSGSQLQLGVNSFCGERVRQIDSKIQLEIGPLNYKDYAALLPSGKLYPVLRKLLLRLCNPTLIIEVVLVIDKKEIKPFKIGDNEVLGLGRGAFLTSTPFDKDQSQTRFLLP